MDSSSFDVCVIGGGAIGLSIALELNRRKLSVCVIERAASFGGESSHAAAGMLAPQSEADKDDDFFRLACLSRRMYEDFARELYDATKIDIELDSTGTLYLAFTEKDETEILARYNWQRRAGFAVELLSFAEAQKLEPHISHQTRRALLFPRDGQVENRRLITALVAALKIAAHRNSRVQLLTDTEVSKFHFDDNDSQITKILTLNKLSKVSSEVHAAHFVLAGGAWSGKLLSESASFKSLAERMAIEPVRGQMLCFATASQFAMRHVIYSPRAYLVPRRDGRLLAGATTEQVGFDKAVTANGVQSVLTNALEISQTINHLSLIDSWAGLRPRAADGLPIIGDAPQISNLSLATAHYRNGILLAPLTACAIADKLTGNLTLDSETQRRLASFAPARFAARTSFAQRPQSLTATQRIAL